MGKSKSAAPVAVCGWAGAATRTLIVATLCVLTGPRSASAADFPITAHSAPVAAQSWAGFYLGATAGAARGRSDLTTIVTDGFGAANQALISSLDTLRLSPEGFTFGGQAGYNWQSGNWIFGIELDVNYLDAKDSRTSASVFVGGGDFTVNNSVKADGLFTARPRLGYAVGHALIYATGGVAVTRMHFASSLVSSLPPALGASQAASISQTKTSWIAGAGMEIALRDNWSAKAEFLVADFGSVDTTSTGGNGATFSQRASLTTQILRAGLNYRFGGP